MLKPARPLVYEVSVAGSTRLARRDRDGQWRDASGRTLAVDRQGRLATAAQAEGFGAIEASTPGRYRGVA
jgi:hypothetical protein